jgi:carboxyl-terminal processing protease
MMGNKKLQVWLPLIFSAIMIVGMFLGYKLGNQSGGAKGFFSSNKRSSLQEAVDLIRMRYVDSVRLDSLEGRAIQEMMGELDPHSVYLPPVDLKAANEDLAGNFEGIGVEFNIFSDTVNVVYVVTNSPSDKAGLQIGDKIIKVNNVLLAGKNFEPDSIKKYIRGERGSKAVLQVIRDNKTMEIPVTRGTIPVPSVDVSYMIDKTTGYIRLIKFTDNSYEEFMVAMEALKKQGMTSLIYDLRSNGGGFMNEAVEMADEFLGGDKLIVYTEGVNSKKREYKCRRPGLFETGKLVVVVDELSASATEVLAGALQDWCRATIIGRRTFGKGLVQEQYPLSDGSAIRLTIARYYTPLGRSIQRSYEKGRKVYMDDLWERYNSGEMLSLDSIKRHNTGKEFTTSCNDTLYGADGITPNVFVPLDTSIAKQKVQKIFQESELYKQPYLYYLNHRQEMAGYASAADFAQRFDASKLWDGYVKYNGGSLAFENITGELKVRVQQRLKAQLAKFRWRNNGLYQVLNHDDPVIQKALQVIVTK